MDCSHSARREVATRLWGLAYEAQAHWTRSMHNGMEGRSYGV